MQARPWRHSLALPQPAGTCPNVLMNRAQTCRVLGWTSAQFDAAVARGFPATKPDPSRGRDWRIDSKAAVAWVAEQEVAKVRPKPVDRGDPPPETPPGLEAVDRLENP